MDISPVSVNSGVVREASGGIATSGKTVKSSKVAESSQPVQTTDGNADVSPAQVKKIVEDMQSNLAGMNTGVQYKMYGDHGEKIAVKVVNEQTGEVIREIPSKEMQSLQAQIGELVGRIFNGKA